MQVLSIGVEEGIIFIWCDFSSSFRSKLESNPSVKVARLSAPLCIFDPTRCAECTVMPEACAWSKGPYPGVLLLYMQVGNLVLTRVTIVPQELAVNRVLSQQEWDNLPSGLLDQVIR